MSPQFVDLDADGSLDIVAGTYDGSPHVAFGSEAGFGQPQQILDRDGERIVLNRFWNVEKKQWETTHRCDAEGHDPGLGHGTSAWAYDHDGDGDLDLLLGDYHEGFVYLRTNEGTTRQPRFARINVPLHAADRPLKLTGKIATMRTVDWDRDGLPDLVCGTRDGDLSDGRSGAVYLFLNEGSATAPCFGPAVTLVPPGEKSDSDGPTRPDTGLHVDLADADSDGDLDLLVGGYAEWQPRVPKLSEEQRRKAFELRQELAELSEQLAGLNRILHESTAAMEEEAAATRRAEILAEQAPRRTALGDRHSAAREQLEELSPSPKRKAFVWFYENLTNDRDR